MSSSTPIKTVVVIGASGSVGPSIVSELLASGFTVSALTRATSSSTFADGVKVIKTDYSPSSLVSAFQGQDAIVSTIATFSTSEQIQIIDAAIQSKVRRFLPSEFGVDTSSPKVLDVLPPAKDKYDTVQYLKSKQSLSFSWTAMIVGGFGDWAWNIGAIGINAKQRTAMVLDGGDIPHEVTNLAQIGRGVAAVLSAEHLEETANQYVYINSFTTTQNEIIKAIENVSGEKVSVTPLKREDVWQDGIEKLKTGEWEIIGGGRYKVGSVSLILAEIHNRSGLNHYSVQKGLWNERLGLPREDVEETVKRVLAE